MKSKVKGAKIDKMPKVGQWACNHTLGLVSYRCQVANPDVKSERMRV